MLCYSTHAAAQDPHAFVKVDIGDAGRSLITLDRYAQGELWGGNHNGLFTHDGYRTVPAAGLFEAEQMYTRRVLAGVQHRWIGTDDQGLIVLDRVTNDVIGRAPDVAAPVMDIALASDGTAWIATEGTGALQYAPDATLLRTLVHPDTVHAVYTPHPDTLFLATSKGAYRWSLPEGVAAPIVADEPVYAIVALGSTIWMGTQSGELIAYHRSHRTVRRVAASAGAPIRVMQTSKQYPGRLWLGSRGQGLLYYDTVTAQSPRPVASLDEQDVFALLEDEQGILWVSTFTGLYKTVLQPPLFTAPLPADAPVLRVSAIEPSARDPNTMWLGTIRQGVHQYKNGILRPAYAPEGHPLSVSFAIHEDHLGQTWFGTSEPYHALYMRPAEQDTLLEVSLPVAPQFYIKQFHRSPAMPNRLWVSTKGLGLLEVDIQGRRLVGRYVADEGSGLPVNDLWTIAEHADEPGILWIGTFGGGLVRFNTTTRHAQTFTPDVPESACLPSRNIVSVYVATPTRLWLGTMNAGLVEWNAATATCRYVTTADGLPEDAVGGIMPSPDGALWLTTNAGLVHLDPNTLVPTVYDTSHGLQGTTFYYMAHALALGGTMLVGGEAGFEWFDPVAVRANTVEAPPVAITEVRIDGQPLPATAELPRLAYSQNDVAFQYAALDLRASASNRYRTRLRKPGRAAATATPWEAVTDDPTERYPALTHGTYVFEVMGQGGGGPWSAPLAVPFQIAPPYWLTWWFWTLVVASVGALATAAYRYRVAYLLRIERLRTRIASDLHDDIGANLSTIALQSELLQLQLGRATPADVQRITHMARSTAHTLREIVWIVNSTHDTLDALVTKLADTTDTLLSGTGIQHVFHAPVHLPRQTLSMDFRQHTFFIVKEMLQNVVKHAEATGVTVTVEVNDGVLQVAVADDGIGFDPATVQSGNGTDTLHRRAAALSGHVAVTSEVGCGTRVQLHASLP
ncbi:MAG: hypothetical protein RhofKO_32070 [Rhodothermales bacterium]